MLKLPEWAHDVVWLDDENAITYWSTGVDKDHQVRCGAHWYHKNPTTGETCFGGFKWANPIPGMEAQATWELVSADPLTISPSLLCMKCQAHGWIKQGKWVPA